eukprot:tig00020830_g14397.t1
MTYFTLANQERQPMLAGEEGAVRTTRKHLTSIVPWGLAFGLLLALVAVGIHDRSLAAQLQPPNANARTQSNAILPKAAISANRGPRWGKMNAEARKRFPHMDQYTVGAPEEIPMWEQLKPKDLPDAWDWRNVSGKNYLTPDRQQHLPVYCGGCWLFSSIHSLNDRISIARNASFPVVQLAHQTMINCQDCGNCEDGGDEYCVYGYMHKHGIPDDTCAVYVAKTGTECLTDGKIGTCKPECYCSNVEPDGTHYAIKKYRKWYLSAYGRLPSRNVHAMKAEIYARGPITCGMFVTQPLIYAYVGGVYKEKYPWKVEDFDHDVSVSGWGVDAKTGEEYWIVRNSWGTFWGEDGWFRIKMYGDNLGIEAACVYGVVDVHRSKDIPPTPLERYYTPEPTPTPHFKNGAGKLKGK